MTYNVFGGTLNLAQSINLINYYIIINTVMNRRVHFSLGLDNCLSIKLGEQRSQNTKCGCQKHRLRNPGEKKST